MGKYRRTTVSLTDRLMELLIVCYLSIMLGLFPLFFLNQYEKIGSLKYSLFLYSSLSFLGLAAVLVFFQTVGVVGGRMRSPHVISAKGQRYYVLRFSFLDGLMLIYGVCVLLSFLFSEFRNFALKGADGWQMGLISQLIFLGTYVILSRYRSWIKTILVTHMISSGIVFLLGILHRFDIDPLGMYPGLTIVQKKEFLSTLGQATWYSSYVCTVFSLGIIVFYFAQRLWIRFMAGIYLVLAFGTIVTQNSDSAFIALAGILVILGLFSVRSAVFLLRFWQLMILLWGSFCGMGILQTVVAERMIPLDALSLFFSRGWLSPVLFLFSLIVYFLLKREGEEGVEKRLPSIAGLYRILVLLLLAAVVGVIVFIWLNTKGYLLEWMNYQSDNNYLYFDGHWGNNRGSSWMIAWQQFKELPWLHKLFGVGPDSFSAYLYSVDEIRELLRALWGNLTLTNAHNEYLNHLICYGAAGLLAWLGVLIAGGLYFYQKAGENPILIGFTLCIAAYGCHNIFCYQQVCCTPFLFLLMGMGEGLTKWGKSPTIIRGKK